MVKKSLSFFLCLTMILSMQILSAFAVDEQVIEDVGEIITEAPEGPPDPAETEDVVPEITENPEDSSEPVVTEETAFALTNAADNTEIGVFSGEVSGIFNIPYRAENAYWYGIYLYQNGIQVGNHSYTATSEMRSKTVKARFDDLIPNTTYNYRAYIRDPNTGNTSYGVMKAFKTKEGAEGIDYSSLEYNSTTSLAPGYNVLMYTASMEGDYEFCFSGSGNITIKDSEGAQESYIYQQENIILSLAENEVMWFYCHSDSDQDPLRVKVSRFVRTIAKPVAETEEASDVTGKTAVLKGHFEIPYHSGEYSYYGFRIYDIKGVEINSTWSSIKAELNSNVVRQVSGLVPNARYTYKAFIQYGGVTVYGEEKEFTSSAADVEIPEITIDCGVTITDNPKALYSFHTDASSTYCVILTGNGSVELYASDGHRIRELYGESTSTLTLSENDTVWFYCCGYNASNPLEVTVSGFVPSVSDVSAITGECAGVSATTANLSGSFKIPYTQNVTYHYGFEVYDLNNQMIPTTLNSTDSELNADINKFADELLPDTEYKFRAFVSGTKTVRGAYQVFRTEAGKVGEDFFILLEGETSPVEGGEMLFRFSPETAGVYDLTLAGEGNATFITKSDGHRTHLASPGKTTVSLQADETLWAFCRGYNNSNPLTVKVTKFVPTVTAVSVETLDVEDITANSAKLSGIVSVPYSTESNYGYGIQLIRSDDETGGLARSTYGANEEINSQIFSQTCTDLIPDKVYTCYAFVTDYKTGSIVSKGESKSFTTASGDTVTRVAAGTPIVIQNSQFYGFTAEENGEYMFEVSGEGHVTLLDVNGSQKGVLQGNQYWNNNDKMIFSLKKNETLWLNCQGNNSSAPLTLVVSGFVPSVTELGVQTGEATDVSAFSASLSGTFSIPYNPNTRYYYGIQLYSADGKEVYRSAASSDQTELRNIFRSFVFDIIPEATYQYKAMIWSEKPYATSGNASEILAEGELKEFTAPEKEGTITIQEGEPTEVSGNNVAYRFITSKDAVYTARISGTGYTDIYSETGLRIGHINAQDRAMSFDASQGDIFWLKCEEGWNSTEPTMLTVSELVPSISEPEAQTGELSDNSGLSVTLTGTFSIPYRSKANLYYGIQLFSEDGTEVYRCSSSARTEMVSETADFVFDVIPGTSYQYKAMVWNQNPYATSGNAAQILAEGEMKEFTALENENTVTIREEELVEAGSSQTIYRFMAPSDSVYVLQLSGNGWGEVYNSSGCLKGSLNNERKTVSFNAARNEVFWIRLRYWSASSTLTIHCCDLLRLPEALNKVGEEAFAGSAVQYVILPDNVIRIESRAFADCPQLYAVEIPRADLEIAENAFYASPNIQIIAPAGGTVESYAAEKRIPFSAEQEK